MSHEDLSKRKLELEIKKLELETAAYEANRKLERTRLWVDNIKWVLAIAATAFLGYLFNQRLEDKKAGITFSQKEQDSYNQQLTNCMNKDALSKVACACTLKDVDPPFEAVVAAEKRQTVERMCSAGESLQLAAANAAEAREAPELQGQQAAVEDAERTAETKRMELAVATSEAERQRLELELKQAQQKQDSLVSASPELQRAAESASTYANAVRSINAVSSGIAVQGRALPVYQSGTVWFKPGYFLLLGADKQFKVLLDKLENDAIRVSVWHRKTDNTLKLVERGAASSLTDPLEFTFDGHKHRIRLESIGPAGKNPFTKAAYITFETLN